MHDREAHDREVYTQLRPSSRPCRPVPSSPSLLCPASLPFTNRTNRCTAVSVGSSATHAKQLKTVRLLKAQKAFNVSIFIRAHRNLAFTQSYPKLFFSSSSFYPPPSSLSRLVLGGSLNFQLLLPFFSSFESFSSPASTSFSTSKPCTPLLHLSSTSKYFSCLYMLLKRISSVKNGETLTG